MSDVIQFPTPAAAGMIVDNYFGGCPGCGQTDGYVNVASSHWFVCDKHKSKWLVGANLFSCWRDESEDDWHHNAELLATYREVKPLPCTDFEKPGGAA